MPNHVHKATPAKPNNSNSRNEQQQKKTSNSRIDDCSVLSLKVVVKLFAQITSDLTNYHAVEWAAAHRYRSRSLSNCFHFNIHKIKYILSSGVISIFGGMLAYKKRLTHISHASFIRDRVLWSGQFRLFDQYTVSRLLAHTLNKWAMRNGIRKSMNESKYQRDTNRNWHSKKNEKKHAQLENKLSHELSKSASERTASKASQKINQTRKK